MNLESVIILYSLPIADNILTINTYNELKNTTTGQCTTSLLIIVFLFFSIVIHQVCKGFGMLGGSAEKFIIRDCTFE